MRRLAFLFVLVAFATTGCGGSANSNDEEDLTTITTTLNDGQVVECVLFNGDSYEGGIWCSPSTMSDQFSESWYRNWKKTNKINELYRTTMVKLLKENVNG